MKDIRFPDRSSSPSDELLSPVLRISQRWWQPKQRLFAALPRKRCVDDGPLSLTVSTFGQVDERSSSTEVSPAAVKLCTQKVFSSARSTSDENQRINSIDPPSPSSKRCRITAPHCEYPPSVFGDDTDPDREDKKKLMMWRTACAMAHAYLYQHDRHQGDGNQRQHHESSLHIIPRLREDAYKQVTEQIKNPFSSSCPPSPPSVEDAPSMRLLSEVVCIDEVVNPTQAAEWFGALLSSNSTLVS